jgi:hypothetical protein
MWKLEKKRECVAGYIGGILQLTKLEKRLKTSLELKILKRKNLIRNIV